MVRHWRDRVEAGNELGSALLQYRGQPVVVLALPRGGVPLGLEVARALDAPLELSIPRKIGHAWNKEYAVGAVSECGEVILHDKSGVDQQYLQNAVQKEMQEAKRRRELYCEGIPPQSLKGKIAIIVDDGIATGSWFADLFPHLNLIV